jgi:hypothetical protein
MKKTLLLSLFIALAYSISATTHDVDVEKLKNFKSNLSFTENKGQISDQNYNPRPDVLFSGAAKGLQFHIRKEGVSYQTYRVDSWKPQDEILSEGMTEEGNTDSVPDQMTIYRTDINWLGFNKDYSIENGEANAGFNNYYLPSCPDGAINVKSYVDVTFRNLYAGIDVKWYEKNGELEYDFIIAPNADYTKISWEIFGADKISIGAKGQLIIETPLGIIEEQAPIAYQGDEQIEATWNIDGNKISFRLGSYNKNEILIIDPIVRHWGTYYGGIGSELGNSCATDTNGNVYLAGITKSSTRIVTTGAHQTSFAGDWDAFLVKFNSSGVRQWGTYYGGAADDRGSSCAIDDSGNVYLAGRTESTTGIATTGAHQTSFAGDWDAFLVKFNSSGVRQWGTYYGGTANDQSLSCATDVTGNVYITGQTNSTTGIATSGAHQTTYGGGNYDACLVKFNSSGVRQWGTYYGGTADDGGSSCTADTNGNVYLAGGTQSTTGIATTGAHQTTYGGAFVDAFLVKFNSSGVRQWGTYYGGTANDHSLSCATDASGNVYITGQTNSTTGIATSGAHQTSFGGRDHKAFLAKFDSSGVRQWGTYYGGTAVDVGSSCATDTNGNEYLAGFTRSTTGIATTGAHQTTYGGGNYDVFLVKFTSSGARQWGTYYGGTDYEVTWSCATDASGNVYLAGVTSSTTGIATTGAHQSTLYGYTDAFLVKFGDCITFFSQDTIVACDSFTWTDGITYTSSNFSATDTFVNYAGCDSVVILNLTLNDSTSDTIFACDSFTWTDGITYTSNNFSAMDTLVLAAGCDKIVTLNLTLNHSTSGVDFITACDSYTWIDGITYTSGNFSATDTLVNAAGCDSIVTLNLTINHSTSGVDFVTACDSFTWTDGITYTSSRISAKDTIVNTAGCDSIVTLFLIINYSTSGVDFITACDSYTWTDGITYTSSNTSATDTLINAAGCDSIVTLNLTLNHSTSAVDFITACDSYTWIDGITYTSSNTSTLYTLVNAAGCDSVITLNLTITTISAVDTITACDSYTWIDGIIYTSSNFSANDTLFNAAGCDSIVTLNLTLNHSTSAVDIITACDSYTWIDGITYRSNNTSARDTFVNAAGCDSIVKLNLTITTISAVDVITACDSFTWIDGNTYLSSNNTATITLVNTKGCDSTVTLNLTLHTISDSVTSSENILTAVESGAQYKWLDCDSNYSTLAGQTAQNFIVTSTGSYAAEVVKNGCIDTSFCNDMETHSCTVNVYPNPTTGILNIDVSDYEGVSVYDMRGRLVIESESPTIDLIDQSKGIYLLKVKACEKNIGIKILKE